MALALTEEKMGKVILKYQNLLSYPQSTVLELTKLIGLMSSTIQAVLPDRLHLRYLQQQQIESLNQACSYQADIVLKSLWKHELLWWVENLRLKNGRSLRQKEPNLVIKTDAAKPGWGAFCNRVSTGWYIEWKYSFLFHMYLMYFITLRRVSKVGNLLPN